MVSCLLEFGANANAIRTGSGGSTPLEMSKFRGYNEISSLLKSYGAKGIISVGVFSNIDFFLFSVLSFL